MILTKDMHRDSYGYVWDPEAWQVNTKERRVTTEAANTVTQTEYESAVVTWHLRLSMEKRFGFKSWMENVVDPATLQWDENGNRVRPKAKRTLNHIPNEQPTQKRSLR